MNRFELAKAIGRGSVYVTIALCVGLALALAVTLATTVYGGAP